MYHIIQKTTTRKVVIRYSKQKRDPTKPSYWRHSAFMHRFVRFNRKWFVEITPTYHFTWNGWEADAWGAERLKKIKEMENNAAVMGQFVMWREFLTKHRADDLLTTTYPFLSFSAIEPFQLDVGVPDDLWKSQEADPSSPLFDYIQAEDLKE